MGLMFLMTLAQWLVARIENSRLDEGQIVRMSVDEVMDCLDVSRRTAEEVVTHACSRFAAKPISGIDLPSPRSFFGIDMFRPGSITEIYGPSGSGKTQLCLTVAASELFDRVFWLDTENTYRSERLVKIGGTTCLERIKVKQVRDFEVMLETSHQLGHALSHITDSVLIVIDSIAMPLRDTSRLMERQKGIHGLAEALKKTGACILVTNHVIADFSRKDSFNPALGNTWSHAVNTRLLVFKDEVTGKRFIRPVKLTAVRESHDIEIGITDAGVILH